VRKFAIACLVGVLPSIAHVTPALARAGTLDPTFGRDGIVENIRSLADVRDILVLPDERILVADARFGVARLEVDGGIDTSFGDDGVGRATFDEFEISTDMALDADGRIVLTGTVGRQHRLHLHIAVVRFTPEGRLDRTFGGDGRVLVECPPRPFCRSDAVDVQPSGKIVTGAWFGGFYLSRFNERGRLDKGFGDDGHVDVPQGVCCNIVESALQVVDRGTVVIAGGGRLARFTTSGALDSTFSNDGMRRLPSDVNPLAVGGLHVYRDGTILVAGNDASTVWYVARYLRGGRPDRTFARNGWRTLSFRGQETVYGLAVQRDDRIVIVGWTFNGRPNGDILPAIARLKPRGRLDSSFSGDGKIVVPDAGEARGVDIQYLTMSLSGSSASK
jgi:uncharacterized delta-60 repeat protein